VFNSIHESGLYSVEDKEVNLREMAFTDHLDELGASSNGLQLTGDCSIRGVELKATYMYTYIP